MQEGPQFLVQSSAPRLLQDGAQPWIRAAVFFGQFEQVLHVVLVVRPQDFLQGGDGQALAASERILENAGGFYGGELPTIPGDQNVDAGKRSHRAGLSTFPRILWAHCVLQVLFQGCQHFQRRSAAFVDDQPSQPLEFDKSLHACVGVRLVLGALDPHVSERVEGDSLNQSGLSILRSYESKVLRMGPLASALEKCPNPLQGL